MSGHDRSPAPPADDDQFFGKSAHDIVQGDGGRDHGIGGVGNDHRDDGPDADVLMYGWT